MLRVRALPVLLSTGSCFGRRSQFIDSSRVLAACLQVRDKQDCLRACTEDLANLTDHFNTVRAAKELAQKELGKIKRQVEEARHDWTRKIRERRAEVRARKMLLAYGMPVTRWHDWVANCS